MTVTLNARAILVEVDPRRGGRIQSIRAGSRNANWLYYDPTRGAATEGACDRYDDVWCGGFEELFPNDAPGAFEGRDLPDHGELWNSPFVVAERHDRSLVMRRECSTVPVTFEKGIVLDDQRAALRLDYRLHNRGHRALRFLFKLHPALALEPGDRILLPGGRVDAVDPAFGTRYGVGSASWPHVPRRTGGTFDLSVVPGPESKVQEFVYVSELPEGWCGLERSSTGERLLIEFPLAVFPFCWLFLAYGGWRDYYTAVLEPCTNMPKDLKVASAEGRCAQLEAGGVLDCSVNVEVQAPHA